MLTIDHVEPVTVDESTRNETASIINQLRGLVKINSDKIAEALQRHEAIAFKPEAADNAQTVNAALLDATLGAMQLLLCIARLNAWQGKLHAVNYLLKSREKATDADIVAMLAPALADTVKKVVLGAQQKGDARLSEVCSLVSADATAKIIDHMNQTAMMHAITKQACKALDIPFDDVKAGKPEAVAAVGEWLQKQQAPEPMEVLNEAAKQQPVT